MISDKFNREVELDMMQEIYYHDGNVNKMMGSSNKINGEIVMETGSIKSFHNGHDYYGRNNFGMMQANQQFVYKPQLEHEHEMFQIPKLEQGVVNNQRDGNHDGMHIEGNVSVEEDWLSELIQEKEPIVGTGYQMGGFSNSKRGSFVPNQGTNYHNGNEDAFVNFASHNNNSDGFKSHGPGMSPFSSIRTFINQMSNRSTKSKISVASIRNSLSKLHAGIKSIGQSRKRPAGETSAKKLKRESVGSVNSSNSSNTYTQSQGHFSSGGKHYTDIEDMVLIGCLYDQMFINPALSKTAWKVISENYEEFFSKHPEHKCKCVRTAKALDRHFKVLKDKNKTAGGRLFKDWYLAWNKMK